MKIKFVLSLLLISLMQCIESIKINSHYKLHLILSNTNCSEDIKCLNNIEIHDLSHSQTNSSVDGSVIKCVEQSYYDQNRKECLNCSNKCPDNSRLEKKCNQTHDIQCVCNSGFFMAIDSGCKPCSQCEPGWGIWRSCWGSRNTVCRKCPPGTFSGVRTGTLGCILCTKCNSSEVMVEECSGVHDSICVDKTKLKYSLNYTKANILEDEANRLPIYFALLIVIILVLIIYSIIQLRIKRMVESGPNFKSYEKSKNPILYHNLYNNTKYSAKHLNCDQIIKNNKLSNNLNQSEKQNNCLIVKRYNELNTSVRRTFEIKLNTGSQSWKSLAKQLGYTNASIMTFECLGRQHLNCVQYFLTDWSKYEDATINSLLKALLKINRLDCALIIDPSLRFTPY